MAPHAGRVRSLLIAVGIVLIVVTALVAIEGSWPGSDTPAARMPSGGQRPEPPWPDAVYLYQDAFTGRHVWGDEADLRREAELPVGTRAGVPRHLTGTYWARGKSGTIILEPSGRYRHSTLFEAGRWSGDDGTLMLLPQSWTGKAWPPREAREFVVAGEVLIQEDGTEWVKRR